MSKINTISQSSDLLRNIDVGEMLRLRERNAELERELAVERALTDRLGTWLCDISDQYQLAEHEQMGVIRCLMAWKRARNPAQTTTEGAE